MASSSSPVQKRIAILGGGIAALSAAYELSHPRQQGQFKVTLYQVGWRLGGKCASGRDLDSAQGMRIEEHGPHALFGFYDNGFEMMEECYAALNRPAGHPFRTFDDAVIGSNQCCVMENVDGSWLPWQVPIVALPGKPGAAGSFSRWQVALNAIDRLDGHVQTSDAVLNDENIRETDHAAAEHATHSLDVLAATHLEPMHAAATRRHLAGLKADSPAARCGKLLAHAVSLKKALVARVKARASQVTFQNQALAQDDAQALAGKLRAVQQLNHFTSRLASPNDSVRRWTILCDLAATVLLGATMDGLLLPTREAIEAANRVEYRDWLRSFHALDMTVNSAIVRAMYDTVFGYIGGDPMQAGDVEAGSAVRAQLDMVSARGHFFFKMRAGTGDVIAAPLYELLKQRGVDFQFFRQVDKVLPSRDGRDVAEVQLIRQAEVLRQPYQPLRECKGLAVWPDRADISQLENGSACDPVAFENYWTPQNPNREVLQVGQDFDAVVLGIGLGALPSICQPLREVNEDWDTMLSKGRTVATQSAQLWLDQPTSASGWPGPVEPVVTSFEATAIDTWFDASHAIAFEDWPSSPPLQMAMVCGPFPGHQEIPAQSEVGYPAAAEQALQQNLDRFLANSAALWPNFSSGGSFCQDRIRSRLLQPGINPSDRYVQTPRDSSRFRLAPGQSGFRNLVLAGDWTDNGLNLGCFEGAVVSGRLAANALGGVKRRILREEPHAEQSRAVARYVEQHPPQSLGGSIVFPGVNMWVFLLRGDVGKLTRLCQRFFDIPTGGQVSFAPLSQIVVMTISEMKHAYFMDAPERGQSTEREFAFGIPGTYSCRDASGTVTERGVSTFMPYLFVDNPVALITGREVLGYFKQLGEVGLPGRAGGREDFYLNVFGAKTLGVGVEWGQERLLSVTARDSQPARPRPAAADLANDRLGVVQTCQSLFRMLGAVPIFPGHSMLATANVRGLLQSSVSQIFLKQFRAEGAGHQAAYQAVTMADYQVTRINSGRPTQSFDISIHPLQSLPLASELGLAAQMVETGIEVNFDMTLGSGRVLWQA